MQNIHPGSSNSLNFQLKTLHPRVWQPEQQVTQNQYCSCAQPMISGWKHKWTWLLKDSPKSGNSEPWLGSPSRHVTETAALDVLLPFRGFWVLISDLRGFHSIIFLMSLQMYKFLFLCCASGAVFPITFSSQRWHDFDLGRVGWSPFIQQSWNNLLCVLLALYPDDV